MAETIQNMPQTSEELVEFLADDKRSAEVFANAETRKEFLAQYSHLTDKSGEIVNQIKDEVSATVAEMLKDNGADDRIDQSEMTELVNKLMTEKPGTGAKRNAAYNPKAPGAKLDGVVNSLGEMAKLINPNFGPQNEDEAAKYGKLRDVKNAYSSSDPASAGFLIPEESRSTILQTALESSVIRSRATVITMTSSNLKIPFVDSTSNASSVYGGMVFYWKEESAAITATEASFGNVTLDAKKLTGGARVPNELWNDAPALQSWIDSAVPSGLAFYEDDAFFNGTGVGQPLGFFNSPAVVAVTRQTASLIDTIDIYNMYARMLPQSLQNAVWIAHPEAVPQLLGLTHDVTNVAGTENVGGGGAGIVQVGNVSGAPTMALLGRPLIVSEKCQGLNTAGDINFVDLGHYLVGDRQAISLDASPHSRFMNDETELRVIERVDGRPWIQSAVTPKRGTDTLSPFVQLAAG